MHKTLVPLGMAIFGMTFVASAQSPASAPPASVNVQLNTQFLNDLMRSAIIFNGMVQGLNVHQALHDSGVASDGRATSAQRAAAVLGAGAGAGMAVGGMTGGQKGAVIGAIAGASGAYVVDQIVQHQAAKARQANVDNYRDNPYPNDREPQHFKERVLPPPTR